MSPRNALAVVAVVVFGVLAGACSSGSSTASSSSTTAVPPTQHPGTVSASPTVWLCRPGRTPDPCAGNLTTTVETAAGSTSIAGSASSSPVADCFYVYPTVSSESTANADLTIQPAEIAVAQAQAERFSSVCRVWAPMYRQQTLADLTRSGLSGDPTAVAVAYASVLGAWRDYLANDNRGRPVVFIGHSQGAAVLIHLLASQIDPDPARRTQMISAIVLGGNVQVLAGHDTGGSFQHIPACRRATQLHCVIAYSSFDRPPPPTSLFARPGQGVSLQSGQRTKVGQQVLCTDPAALAGGTGTLDPYFLAVGRSAHGRPIATPWVTYPNMYAARCATANGATWLQITHVGGAGDQRPDVKPLEGPDWGLHVDDVNLALGNLVAIVARQIHAEPS